MMMMTMMTEEAKKKIIRCSTLAVCDAKHSNQAWKLKPDSH